MRTINSYKTLRKLKFIEFPKNAFYELTGTLTGNRTLTMPSGAERSIIVKDSTTRGASSSLYSLSVATASGTSVPIPIGASVAVVSDGTNMKLGLLSKGYGTINSASVTSYTAVAGDQLLTNTTTAGISITLPNRSKEVKNFSPLYCLHSKIT